MAPGPAPAAGVPVTRAAGTVIVAVDVSNSMAATDVPPNRITAAEKAATAFIKAQPAGSRIGLVTFSGIAGLLVPPTTDTTKLLDALQNLTTSRGTAIGQGILTSIDAIADADPSVAPTGATVSGNGTGPYAADVIVVLTDGANTQGVDPQTAAKQAAARRLRVYTTGFGTTTPAPMVCGSSQAGNGAFGGFGGFGGGGGGGGGGGRLGDRRLLVIGEQALRQVAATTGGAYYRAQNAGQLQDALGTLPRNITVTHKHKDIAAWFAGIGAAVGLSLWWNRVRRLPAAAGSPPPLAEGQASTRQIPAGR
ncbi:VWA domain-containing protein [Pseudofrankia sp. DC12]|uniref:VWA domain-containing protein n=1 Tax=Pseudofrankia sp. DC12 TaxID=683315 RepID=UPI000A90A0DF|nr:VWA domain-containing protein [Pseudofrankia sp. DC12]